MPRFFTVEQANAMLPALTRLLDHLVQIRDHLVAQRPDVSAAIEKSATNGGNRPASLAVEEFEEFQSVLLELKGLGVLLKDIDMGLVDFPSRREGRDIYLCWRKGEPRVAFWHDVDSGYAGRRPL
ncbi:MAG: DUF2203 domain-containing protein [Anaerolineae bacterium]